MASRNEKLAAVAVAVCLLALGILNRLYRSASRNDVSMFSREAFEAGWLYWVGMLVGVIGCIGYWVHSAKRKGGRGQ